MPYSSILGADQAAVPPSGRDSRSLGPSDNSDTGSDTVGTSEAYADSDAEGTGERGSVGPGEAPEGADIMPDHVVGTSREEEALATGQGFPENDIDAREYTDLDAAASDSETEGGENA